MKKSLTRILSGGLVCFLLCSLLSISTFAADTSEFDPPDNVIRNAGFEQGDTEWDICPTSESGWFNTGIYELGDNTHFGTYCALLGNHTGSLAYLCQEVDIPNSGCYELSAYVAFADYSNAQPVYMTIDSDLTGEVYSTELQMEEVNSWQKVSMEVDLSFASLYRVSFASADNVVLIDDVAMVPLDPPAPPPPQPVQLLTNGGFEGSMSGWAQRGTPNAFLTNSQSRSGSGSLYLGYFQNEGLTNYVEQSCVSGKGSYDFSVWIKTDPSLSGVGAALFLEARDKNGTVLATTASQATGDSGGVWKKLSAHLDAPDGTHTVAAKLGGVYCTGAFYADDAQLLYLQEA